MVEISSGTAEITVPEKYRQYRLRHSLNSILVRSSIAGVLMLVLLLTFSQGLSPLFCLLPALLMLARGLPGWFVANAGPWTFLVDDAGIQLRYGKSSAKRVSPGDAPSALVWENNTIAEVDLTTVLGLPAIKLFATTPKGTLKHQMTVVYETEDAQVINKSVLPMIDKYRSKSKRKSY